MEITRQGWPPFDDKEATASPFPGSRSSDPGESSRGSLRNKERDSISCGGAL
ncbi:hypothetical protein TIFTF001_015760 [Ficus carica]|uniref:Uncharacterized protein n=1 Tax=Ficus carica TaxID=3494 RepID=A0AA88DIQ1_FICCA|nr:hypothetical protein TIFTF001_015760 [Ficus carica]